ncbi:hypothetical protein [Achromobacter marplatensis]
MTDQTNAKPLTGDEIRAAVKHAHNMTGPSDATQPGEYVLAGALALLSKLRAEGVQAGDERAALSGLLDYVDRNTCTHENRHKVGTLWTICDDCGRKWASDRNPYTPHQDAPAVAAARAALASAPVAGEADYYAVMHGNALYGVFDSEAAADACKAKGHPDAPFSVKPLYAAPQASEAVRNAGIAASEDHMRPDLDRGVPGSFTAFSQWVMNQPNDQIYVHSAQEGFLAGVEWSRQQRTGVCLPEYLNDLRYHDQYRIGWNRCLEVCRAALSAQPAAQIRQIPANLLERLHHHAGDKSNTAFARSTMHELAAYLDPKQHNDGGTEHG